MERFNATVAALMCVSLISPSGSAMAETVPSSTNQPANHASIRPSYKSSLLQGDERILHALNRFTFGPKPGDIEAVKGMGLDRWFQQQLHPATIDQADLDARLAEYPAMQLSPQDLLFRFPTNGVIRQTIDKKAPEPQNAVLRKIYDDEIFRYDQRRQEKQQKQQQLVASMTPSMAGPASAAENGSYPARNMDTGMSMNSSPAMDSSSSMVAPSNPDMASPEPSESLLKKKPQAAVDRSAVDLALVAAIAALPPEQRVARLANMPEPDLDNLLKGLKPPQRLSIAAGLTPGEKEYLVALAAPQRVVNQQRLTRDIYSNAQFQEVMTDFWLNHFNVYLHKNDETPYYLVSYERDVIRPRALGKFEDLLEATAHSPAMLALSRQLQQHGPRFAGRRKAKEPPPAIPQKEAAPEGLNENYARELMELHTLGVNGGYTQADVTQVARVLTGWTVDKPQRGGGFKFDENRHEPEPRKSRQKNQGARRAGRPRAAAHARHTPRDGKIPLPQAGHPLRRRRSSAIPRRSHGKVLTSSDGDISEVLKTLFHSPSSGLPTPIAPRSKRRLNTLSPRPRQQRQHCQHAAAGPTPCATWACRSMARSRPPATSGTPPTGSAPALSSTA
jgi:hypothetical protein